MTTKNIGVAEAKKHFSELLGRVAYGGERIKISKRGKAMALLVPVEDVGEERHLSEVNGWLENDDPFFSVLNEIMEDRRNHKPRVL